jgi:hypothetical protein
MLTMKQEYDELIEKLETVLPFEAYPTRDLVIQLRTQWKITLKTMVNVVSLHNLVEIGGICCGLEGLDNLNSDDKEVIICGLTHLLIPPSNPFYKEIIKYQTKRAKWINKQ